MPLHGKIVVIKRSGGDGTEFPLTATCLFGRKPDCDIRIQLPQVSKEHCRIDLNENKEVVLTNLSSVNPTRVNGEALQQSERLKHGDVITIIDRSFRFEYPPAPTPKKRSSTGGKKAETLKVLQDQQVSTAVTAEQGEKRVSDVFADGTNHDNIQRSLEKTMEMDSTEDGSLLQEKSSSPFGDLYQMIKKSLDVKTPRKSSISFLQTPSSKFCTPKPVSVRKNDGKPVGVTEDRSTPKKDEAKVVPGADETKESVESVASEAPKSVKKQRRSSQVVCETPGPAAEEAKLVSPKRSRLTPQRFSVSEVIEQVAVQTPKSPVRRRSKEASPAKPEQEEKTKTTPKTEQQKRTSPRNSGKAEKAKEVSKKRKSGELADDLPTSQMKRKRVSFGGFLAPELFDKRLPPDSPLRKGATPRRSMGNLTKPKQSLLRRASVTGFLAFDGSPSKMRTPSPKKSSSKNASPKTPTSGKKSPKSRSPSPKAASPAKKSPKARTPSPKKASSPKKSPKSRSPSPAKKTPKARTTSPKAASPGKKSPAAGKSPSIKETPTGKKSSASPQGKAPTPAKTPLNSRISTPTVQGRFSVSRINTPSPVSDDVVPDQMLSVTVTPKIPLRRKSMKSASRKTPSISKSAAKVIRRSGISRASIKIKSFADIVKFGQAKAAVAAPAKKMVVKTTKKKTTMSKLKTPAKNLKDHVSTGHANSPVTIVVGRAHKQTVVYPTGAAPKVVANIALLKKNMKMDEDLTGISEMFKTPVNERKRRSVSAETSAVKTPVNALSTSVVEPSVLSTPEEPGEMIVSPMSVTSAVKGTRYNSEAVQRLLDADQESSFISDTPVPEIDLNESNDQQGTDVGTPVSTPKQKPEKPDCLTGVKRIMKTPRQKAEPVEDLRGKLLKTPKQKPEQRECLTGVKRMMKTPKQKAEPIEDLRGKILKTPKQKMEQKECLTGVKRIMKTPKQKAEAVEDIRGKLLVTPKQKPEQQECLSGVKRIFKTPQREVEPVEDVLKTPKASEAGDVILETSADVQESETTNVENAPVLCVTDVKRVMKMPKEKSAPVEDMVGVKRLMKTPKQKAEPVEDNFGIKKLMRSPRLRGIAPVEDFEGLSELMEEPLTKPAGQMETDETKDVSSDHDNKSPESMETISQEAVDVSLQVEQPKVDPVDAAAEPDHEKKPVRGRRGKAAESKAAQDKQVPAEASEEPVAPPPARGRRGKKTEAASSTAVRQTTRTRGKDVELTMDESTPRPRRGRNAKKASDDQPETTSEVATETHTEPEAEHEQIPAVNVDHKANDSEAPQETTVSKPRRGRKAKPASEQSQDVPSAHVDDIPPADVPKDANEVCSEQLEPVPSTIVENVSSHAVETVAEAPVTESLPEVGTQTCRITEMDAAVQKKPVRGRRGKMAEPKAAEDKQDCSEDPVVPAPVRGRRGKKTEAAAAPAVKQTARTRNARSQETTTADEPKMVQESSVETQAEPEISTEAVSDQTSMINASQEKNDSAAPAEEAIVKTTRGRKTKMPVETPEPEKNESVSEESLKAETIVEKPRRGRKAKTDVEQNEIAEDVVAVETKQQSQPPVRAKRGRNAKQQENDGETSAPTTQEPVKKARRTRKAEPEQVEAKEEEMQTTEIVVPEEPEAAPEPVKVNEPVTATAKPRRGGRKAKQDAESETPAESTEVQEVPVVSSTDKPKRGRKGKRVTAEVEVTPEEPKPEAEEEKNAEPEPPVKATRAKGKSSARNEVSQAKRARRGAAAAVEETTAESVVEVSESAPAPVEAPKRGRRKAAEPTTVSSDQASPSEDTSSAVMEDAKTSKRSVKWKENLEVFQIPKETPVKAVRGRKSKLQVQAEAESKNVSKDASKTEEKDLSEETVEVQPVKRARRGAKMADEAESSSKAAETESQPKTRRGRPAKK